MNKTDKIMIKVNKDNIITIQVRKTMKAEQEREDEQEWPNEQEEQVESCRIQ